MKILVLAQTPPPLHGQSLMVEKLVVGLPSRGFEVHHVQIRLSRSHADIGVWRFGKMIAAIRAAFLARRIADREKCDALYYVPAPGKRGALYRDIIVMGICRRSTTKLVLHWHAPGLGAWLKRNATGLEWSLAQRALGRSDLSIILSPELKDDADFLNPSKTLVVTNGIEDNGTPAARSNLERTEILFIGLGSREKGLRDTVEALTILEGRSPGRYRLKFAGSFPDEAERLHFEAHQAKIGGAIQHVGFAGDAQKRELFSSADIFCLPTEYPNEGQPIALIEALSYDLKIITTRWRSIPSMLPYSNVWYVQHGKPAEIASAIEAAAASPRPEGAMRKHYLQHFTLERHLSALGAAFESLER